MVKPARRVSGLNFKVAVGRHAYCNIVLRRRRTTAPKTDVNETLREKSKRRVLRTMSKIIRIMSKIIITIAI